MKRRAYAPISWYAPTGVCEIGKIFYIKLDLISDYFRLWDTLIVFGDFTANIGTRGLPLGYVLIPDTGIKDTSNSLFLNSKRFKRLRFAGSWYQRLKLHC